MTDDSKSSDREKCHAHGTIDYSNLEDNAENSPLSDYWISVAKDHLKDITRYVNVVWAGTTPPQAALIMPASRGSVWGVLPWLASIAILW